MQKLLLTLVFYFASLQIQVFAQYSKRIDELNKLYQNAATDSQKVILLGELANLYYIYRLDSLAAATLHQQLLIAEVSNNDNLVLTALFGDAITNIGYSASTEDFDKTIAFIKKGIAFAKANDLYDFIALGYVRMSATLRRRGEYQEALKNANFALSSLEYVSTDSIRSLTHIELGDAYLAKDEAVLACTQYNTAFDFAVRIGSVALQSRIYHCLSEMYKQLGNDELAREELNKSMELNKEHHYGKGLTHDYYDLARLTDEKYFIDLAIQFADSLELSKYSIASKRLMLAYYQVVIKDSKKSLAFLENEPDLKQHYKNSGIENYYGAIANCFFWGGVADSAVHYFALAEPEILKKSDKNNKQIIFQQLAESYDLNKNFPMAVKYYLNSVELSKEMGNMNVTAELLFKLSAVYEHQNEYKNALLASKEAIEITNKLKQASKESDIALLGVSREQKKHEQEVFKKEQLENTKRNLQYMAITIVIVIVFFIMLVIGSFSISKIMIRMMGYFFFISVFEFIILLIDSLFLHYLYNHPLKLWLVKIFLIAMLVPLQHFLEKAVTGLLASKKLIKARTQFSLKRWFAKMKKPSPKGEGIESDTAVL